MKDVLRSTQEWTAIVQLLEAQNDALAIFVEKLQEIDRKPTPAVQMACSKYVKYVYIHLDSILLTSGRVIQEILEDATKPVKPPKKPISEQFSSMRHGISVADNNDAIVNLKTKMDEAFQEFFVSRLSSAFYLFTEQYKRMQHS